MGDRSAERDGGAFFKGTTPRKMMNNGGCRYAETFPVTIPNNLHLQLFK